MLKIFLYCGLNGLRFKLFFRIFDRGCMVDGFFDLVDV